MQDDALDKLLKDAAGQYHPGYNDRAWERMQQLLDRQLPQEKERRRTWPWLLLPLLVTFVAAGLVWNNNSKRNSTSTSAGSSAPVTASTTAPAGTAAPEPATAPAAVQPGGDAAKSSNTVPPGTTTPAANSAAKAPATAGTQPASGKKVGGFRSMISVFSGTVYDINDLDRAGKKPARKAAKTAVTVSPAAPETAEQTDEQPAKDAAGKIIPEMPAVNTPETAGIPVEAGKTAATEPEKTAATEKTIPAGEKPLAEKTNSPPAAKQKNGDKKSSRFADNIALTISAGPDYSFVKTNQPGQVQLSYGAGLAYTFAKRFTARAGFYAAKKVYTTDSASYKPKVPLSAYYNNIQKIDGDCMVYEIPFSLSYSFSARGRRQWFAGAGISTLIMKRETYTYYYYRNGTLVSRTYTLNDENQHRFSVLTLSGGFQYRLSNRVSVSAEPYIKLPLSGIGYGNLLLNSGGIQFSAAVSPFRKRK